MTDGDRAGYSSLARAAGALEDAPHPLEQLAGEDEHEETALPPGPLQRLLSALGRPSG